MWIIAPCDTCKDRGRCRDENDMRRQSISAFLRDEEANCTDHRESTWRGLEGVAA